MLKVAAFGEALIDMIPDYGDAGPGGARPRAFIPSPGGAPANIAVAVARLGGDARFLGKVGRDFFGNMIRDALNGYGVNTEHLLQTEEAPTALAFVAHDTDGERSFSFYRSPSADLLYRPEEFPEDAFAPPGIFHVCSNTLTEPAIRETTMRGLEMAHRHGCLVSVDVNYRGSLWPEPSQAPTAILSLMGAADVVKLSLEELQELYGKDALETTVAQLLGNGVSLVVVTDGGAALHYYTPTARSSLQPPSVKAVDTTAAGDAFVGGLLYALAADDVTRDGLSDWLTDTRNLETALAFAARCGALAASRYGAYNALPTAAEVSARE
ncbi:MAG: carbohydrate kinase [Ectothiorhodospiraceae bacterium]|jgi:fructokinase